MQVFKAQDLIIQDGSENNVFYIILEGTVLAQSGGETFPLKKGDIVGIFDIAASNHFCSYIANEDCTLVPYSYHNTEDFLNIINKNEDLGRLLILSLTRNIYNIISICQERCTACRSIYNYIVEIKDFYQYTCRSFNLSSKTLPFMEEFQDLAVDDELPFWMIEYYQTIKKIITDSTSVFSSGFIYGFLSKSSNDIEQILYTNAKMLENSELMSSYLLNDDNLDFFDLYCDLYFRSKNNGLDVSIIDTTIKTMIAHLRDIPAIDKTMVVKRVGDFQRKVNSITTKETQHPSCDNSLHDELQNSINIILDYANTIPDTVAEFRKYLDLFKQLPDRNSLDKEADAIRRKLNKLFLLVYVEVFQIILKQGSIPTIIKMFLNFGYLDPDLCGYDNAHTLYKIAETFHGNKELGIYTIYEWIHEIYIGNKQPSRNEFEQDYSAYVRNLKREGKIDKETERNMVDDKVGKVMYELQNMLPNASRITFGRLFTYSPILLEESICKPLDSLLLTPDRINDIFNKLILIDYSAFYHEILFEEPSISVKEMIKVDIRPDIILMPNIGSKGILWQEIEGMHRNTHGRMMISAFHLENPEKTFIRMIGEYRWEMCKRIQGARWNDVTSHSLTSDYCDYAQFFSKNRDLSYEAKEKIKIGLKKSKNNYRELFLSDYLSYILYESTGSCRLNKVARSILFRFCPFGNEIRDVIKNNTIFSDCLARHHLEYAQVNHRLEQISLRYQNAGMQIPQEISSQHEMITK